MFDVKIKIQTEINTASEREFYQNFIDVWKLSY